MAKAAIGIRVAKDSPDRLEFTVNEKSSYCGFDSR